MLVLARKKGESVVVDNDVRIVVVDVRGDKVRLGVEAPADVEVYRQEVWEKIQAGRKEKDKESGQDDPTPASASVPTSESRTDAKIPRKAVRKREASVVENECENESTKIVAFPDLNRAVGRVAFEAESLAERLTKALRPSRLLERAEGEKSVVKGRKSSALPKRSAKSAKKESVETLRLSNRAEFFHCDSADVPLALPGESR